MIKKIYITLILFVILFAFPPFVFASPVDSGVIDFTKDTLSILTVVATASAVFFLVKSGYLYITSTGNPEILIKAKRTIKNALIGLILVLASNIVMSVFQNALNGGASSAGGQAVEIITIEEREPSDGLTQVLIDAVSSFIQNIVESATEPIVNGVLGYLTQTPTLFDNEVVRKFWLVNLGIVDAMFVLIVALLGLQVMSASTFGFNDMDFRQILPRIGIAFLGANISLFLADYAIITCNALVKAVLNSTGGLNHAWVVDALSISSLKSGATPLIILIFLVLFLIVSIVLLFLYISRLIMISLGAVLSPFIFMLWTLPKFSDFAFICAKTYFVNIFVVFVHVVIVQLAGSFLALPSHGENSLISIAVAIGLFFTLIKTPSLMMQMIYYNSSHGNFRKIGGQIINVISSNDSSSISRPTTGEVKTPRKVIKE